ncbi:glycoside hydrolase family 3 C-terminal domain-containing protein [Bacteroides sp. 51]|uniref:glycoside hydrolase family 3 C-terminal domain-containing protein n=1 Tax=Bacteroides sp. 51 TaxID=2302938 RepID=UPI0013D6324E|nr:glycoside hydrolase family 3 C-terminal domain-containing protein [Bacteroides sp. 51]NDV81782.1 glycosyl hydrolase [Bacteroides sp. 51]
MKTNLFIILSFVFSLSFYQPCRGQEKYAFRNTSLSVDERVTDLVSRLTLEEKVLQMLNDAPAIDRLGIPSYNWWNECLHGIGRTEYKVTVFPQAIGMAAAWDDVTFKQVAAAISDEGRAIYNDASSKGNRAIYHGLTFWTPNINIFRDPRWGRGQETYGEDPYLTGTLGKAFVEGLQGDDPMYLKASACAKHFAVHSGPENTRHTFNTKVSDYDLWDTYLPAFRDLIVDANVSGVMCAYNAFGGEPCCGNTLLMQDILRNKWNFTGYVTSDCGAIDDFYRQHKTHLDAAHASADAVYHGTDIDCGQNAYKGLVEAVKKGLITEDQIDVSLSRLFKIRFRLGLFDPAEQVKYSQIPLSVLECDAHKELSLKMARQSIVLLKNSNQLLPLKKNLKKIAVIGPNADNKEAVLGNYNGFPSEIVTPLQAIKQKVGKKTEVIYTRGIDPVGNVNNDSIALLVNSLKNVDVVVMVGGISPQLEGEEMPVRIEGFNSGDRTSIALPRIQTELMKALHKENIPVVFVMMTGSALGIAWEAENLPAILNAWYGGQDAGTAIADVLFGDYNPSGRLPVTFYKSDKDLPSFNDFDMDNRTYRYFKGEVTYPFGYGLSYADFGYSSITMKDKLAMGEKLRIEVDVTNQSKKAGEEVVQVYVSYQDAAYKAPLYSLKSFKRVQLKAGETSKVTFELTPEQLSQTDIYGNSIQYPGKVKIYVGGSSPAKTTAVAAPIVSKEINIQ